MYKVNKFVHFSFPYANSAFISTNHNTKRNSLFDPLMFVIMLLLVVKSQVKTSFLSICLKSCWLLAQLYVSE